MIEPLALNQIKVTINTRNLPIAEINNLCQIYDLDYDCENEEIVLFSIDR